MNDCIFCKIVKGEIPCAKLYEDDKVLAFLDIGPVAKGHALVVSKQHYETLLDTPDEIITSIFATAKRIAAAQQRVLGNKGFNILMNNKKVAGQLVPHSHIHIIPRKENDGLLKEWPAGKYKENEMNELLEKIKDSL